jgi:IclR family transcriptional regulator, acetate operon repressor
MERVTASTTSVGVSPRASKPDSGTLLTLQRGLRLLEAIAEDNSNATAKSLSYRLGLKKGTCYHLLRTLEEEGYIVRLAGGRFTLGGRIAVLQDSVRAALAPLPQFVDLLMRLHERLEETVYISGWCEDDIVLQRYIEGSKAVHVGNLEIGYRENMHTRASGKAILAFLPVGRVRAYFATRGLPPRTPNTITDLGSLVEYLETVARSGVAIDIEEFSQDVCCVAATIFDRKAYPVGSYAASVPAMRFEARRTEVTSAVRHAAVEASRYLGYSRSYPPKSPLIRGDLDDVSCNDVRLEGGDQIDRLR